MSRIPPDVLDEIDRRIVLSAVVGRGVALKKKGRHEFVGLCPFHNEKIGSFTVNDAKRFFHCFGCGAHGNALGFLMRRDGLSFRAAAEQLAGECGVTLAAGAAFPDSNGSTADIPAAQQAAAHRAAEVERQRRDSLARQVADEEQTRRWAWRKWQERSNPHDGPVETYLRGRGIDYRLLPALPDEPNGCAAHLPNSCGLHPALVHGATGEIMPAMLLAMQDSFGTFRALHRTFLGADGGKAPVDAAKQMIGRAWGSAVHFEPRPLEVAETAYIGEGFENTCVVAMAVAEGKALPGIAFYAALSLGNMAGGGDGEAQQRSPLHPDRRNERGERVRLPTEVPDMARPGFVPPKGTRAVVLCEDADEKDPAAAEALKRRAANRFALLGLQVRRVAPPRGLDFASLYAVAQGAARVAG